MRFPTPITCREVWRLWWLSSFCFSLFQVNKMKKTDKTRGHEQALKDGSNTYDTSPQNSFIFSSGDIYSASFIFSSEDLLSLMGFVCLVNPSRFIIHILACSALESSCMHNFLQQKVYSSATHCMRTHLHWFAWSPYPANLICWPLALVLAETLDSRSLTTSSLAHRIFQTSLICSFSI